jgi:2,3,4,5-tetrahydropyridine-2-carboxylate N-succinyltransferase
MKGFVPARSVVIPGSYTKKFPAGDFQVPVRYNHWNTQAIYRLKTS